MPDFIVKVDGIKLSKEQQATINGEIQAAVMRGLAKIDSGAELNLRIPYKEWLGIWIRNRNFDVGNIKLQVNEIKK